MFAQLPAELKLAIAHFVRLQSEDHPPPALRSLCLVSKPWSTAAQVALFYRIQFHSSKHVLQLMIHLHAFPHLSGYVRDVQVSIREHQSTNLSDVLNMTSMLPNLVALELGHSFVVPESEEEQIVPTSRSSRHYHRLETLRLFHFSGSLEAFDTLFHQFSAHTLCIFGMLRLYQYDSSALGLNWSFESAISPSTIQRLDTDKLTFRLLNTSSRLGPITSMTQPSILQPFVCGALQSLRCPLVDGDRRLAPLVALFRSGLASNLSELELTVANGDVLWNELSGVAGAHEEDVDSAAPASNPSLSLSLPFVPQLPYQTNSTSEFPEWQYALRLVASAHLAPLTRIALRTKYSLTQLDVVDDIQRTVFGTLNWAHLDEVLDESAALEAFEIVFEDLINPFEKPRAPSIPASFKLFEYLEEQMPDSLQHRLRPRTSSVFAIPKADLYRGLRPPPPPPELLIIADNLVPPNGASRPAAQVKGNQIRMALSAAQIEAAYRAGVNNLAEVGGDENDKWVN
ncbi:hypothetical protein EIP91_008426 [Steccherinum ochraceum]|uniref:F-box domain-containing protein n=1 Tax=Steccherinum ochraceum TaxID=92696 RepID=A0A4V2MVE6_9APHY|nr:hypothetical protein EIP91_008426 [Steccherinum ochraceum]